MTERKGYPSRTADLDALPGFRDPPPGYGEVAFYWWVGEKLDRERLKWQLEKLKGRGVSGLQINYAHDDRGGRSWGLSYPSDPPLFSEDWWDLFGWFLGEAKKLGISVSLSDYTLGAPGQGWYVDEILAEEPSIRGAVLEHALVKAAGGTALTFELPPGLLACRAYRIGRPSESIELMPEQDGSSLELRLPEGNWTVAFVWPRIVPLSIDPLNPRSGAKVIEKFFGTFEQRFPGEAGSGLDFFFSDELDFGLEGDLWNEDLPRRFADAKGYDLLAELPGLFMDIGPRTPKIRLDYRDVMVVMEEEGYFRPLWQWHQERGMIYGCDHGGRGRKLLEFGDYFRTQRWNQGPGNDQPRLESDLVKNKVASSIAHLYERPRTWLEGFHSSGWGTSSAQLADAIFRNFAQGHNLLSLHGLYYTTLGLWWEWAPPCNHFRMPYWEHMAGLMKCAERLSYILSQGRHVCDLAIVYPSAALEADPADEEAVRSAFAAAELLYPRGMDFDFIDFQSLERATFGEGHMSVSGERYAALVIPAMGALRHSTLVGALELFRAGGIVVALGRLPEASERIGRGDPRLLSMLRELFGLSPEEARTATEPSWNEGAGGGAGLFLPESRMAELESRIAGRIGRDIAFPQGLAPESGSASVHVQHRRVGFRDLYFVYGLPRGTPLELRATGAASLWNPWTGETRALAVLGGATEGFTRIAAPLDRDEAQLIVFDSREAEVAESPALELPEISGELSRVIELDGPWDCLPLPTMDNRWGDFRMPPSKTFIGPELHSLGYRRIDAGDGASTAWVNVRVGFGPRFEAAGPFSDPPDLEAMEKTRAALAWREMESSERWGIPADPGHQGYHGLKGEISDDQFAFGKMVMTDTGSAYESEEGGAWYLLRACFMVPESLRARVFQGSLRASAMRLNGISLDPSAPTVELEKGANLFLLAYEGTGRGAFVLVDAAVDPEGLGRQDFPLAASWFRKPGYLRGDVRRGEAPGSGEYRFLSAPGLGSLTLSAAGRLSATIGGEEATCVESAPEAGGFRAWRVFPGSPIARPAEVVLRLEHEMGIYGGAALEGPIAQDCGEGKIDTGDWSSIDGLRSYSGCLRYAKEIELEALGADARCVLDLGEVLSSVELLVNGISAGTRVAPPWRFDITGRLTPGKNRLELLVCNTLANAYSTVPSRYSCSTRSGLLGPVRLFVRIAASLSRKVGWEYYQNE